MEKELLKKLGKNILLARKACGVTQGDLAAKTGMGQSHISKIEKGEKQLSLFSVSRIAEALDTSVGALLGEASPPPPADLSAFESWCDERGFRTDRYHALALWLVRHLSPSGLSEAMAAMTEDREAEFRLVSDSPSAKGSDEEQEAFEAVMEEVEKAEGSPGKRRKDAG